MTAMNILDVINIVYPGQFELGNLTVGQDGTNIFITMWKVPNVAQPTTVELEAMIPSLQNQFDLTYFVTQGAPQLAAFVDSVAQQQQYADGVSCASYINSTNNVWKAQAEAFIAWRDSVYTYVIAQEALMQSGARSIPAFAEFQTELPVIAWPA